MKRHLLTAITVTLLGVTALWAQNVPAAFNELESFRRMASQGQPGINGYQALYRAFECYSAAANTAAYGSPVYNECKSALREIFPRLADGAYYYASLNNQEEVLKFACAYVDVSLLKCMASDGCQRSAQYPMLSNLAATNLYNRRQYDQSITYFSAYLESGDPQNRETAFEGLARCFFEKKDYARAANICHQGTREYHGNMNMLLIGIESCGHNGNDTEMEPMLERALALQPNHRGLLEYQGKLYERTRRYDDAAASFAKICRMPGATLDHTCHLAFDYYNAGTLAYTRAKAEGKSIAQAQQLFNLAAPHLRTVLNNMPNATNVARALALCYSLTNDATRLSEANRTLQSLNAPSVNLGALPTLVQNYTPSAEINQSSASATAAIAMGKEEELISDVDINIPETKLNRPNTYVVVIANENYKNSKEQTVDFAIRDGEKFKEYCHKVLGVPQDNVHMRTDASLAEMKKEVDFVIKKTEMNPDKLDIIIYYAGHGNADFAQDKSYLIPADAAGTDFDYCYSLDNLYKQLDECKARNVTVFLDACFSGRTRSGNMVASGRFTAMAAADQKPGGKTVVFTGATGKQASLPYKEKGHGFFTYYLLKHLQESKGRISLYELGENIKRDVANKVFDLQQDEQTPTVTASESMGNSWRNRTLID